MGKNENNVLANFGAVIFLLFILGLLIWVVFSMCNISKFNQESKEKDEIDIKLKCMSACSDMDMNLQHSKVAYLSVDTIFGDFKGICDCYDKQGIIHQIEVAV